jgi:hypothetical protein
MNKEFVSYEIALELKELGFDEPCFGWYQDKTLRIDVNANQSIKFHEHLGRFKGCFLAPTFSQAFRWFREKYNIVSEINVYSTTDGYSFSFKILCKKYTEFIEANNAWVTYEEAELSCLKKLIEIVKQPKKD